MEIVQRSVEQAYGGISKEQTSSDSYAFTEGEEDQWNADIESLPTPYTFHPHFPVPMGFGSYGLLPTEPFNPFPSSDHSNNARGLGRDIELAIVAHSLAPQTTIQ